MSTEKRIATSQSIRKKAAFLERTGSSLGFDENMDKQNWKAVRKVTNLGYKFSGKDKDVKVKKTKLGGVKAVLAYNKKSKIDESHIILYIHGGGFVMGESKTAGSYCLRLAKYSNNPVYSVNYSLAPEHPYPEGFKDCVKALDYLFEKYPKSKFSITGESAGGNLSLAVALKAKKSGRISSVVVHSPIVDLSGIYDRSGRELVDFIVRPGIVLSLQKIYAKDNSLEDPYISPIYGDYKNFPPTYITCDTKETLYEDSITLHDKLEAEKIKVKLIEMRNSYHAFPASSVDALEIDQILKESVEFMKESAKEGIE